MNGRGKNDPVKFWLCNLSPGFHYCARGRRLPWCDIKNLNGILRNIKVAGVNRLVVWRLCFNRLLYISILTQNHLHKLHAQIYNFLSKLLSEATVVFTARLKKYELIKFGSAAPVKNIWFDDFSRPKYGPLRNIGMKS